MLAAAARLPPAQDRQVSVERDLAAKMADGIILLADRWVAASRSGSSSPPPIVLLRSPYGRRQVGFAGRLFAERGYQAVIQSCRGTFGSGGEFEPFRHEEEDGATTLAWLAEQPWFGGSVFTFGPSYLGMVQWAVAGDPPPWLRAMAPGVTATFFRDAVVYPSDTLGLETMLSWVYQVENQERRPPRVLGSMLRQNRRVAPGFSTLPLADADRQVVGRRVPFFQDWLVHDRPGDPWWKPVDFRAARSTAPPSTFLGGWYDLFLPRQIEDFAALRAAGREALMTIGPWTHASPAGMGTSLRDALGWFAAHGGASGRPAGGAEPGVRLFVMGSGRWVNVPDWPPPATTRLWHLQPGGGLAPDPAPGCAPDHFRFDPSDPTPGIGGASLASRNAGRKDQRRREGRPDVLTYTSAPMAEDVTVAGPLSTDLWFRSSLGHTDVSVRLCVVSAKGRSYNLSDGYRRLRPGDVSPASDSSVHLRIEMWPTAVTFRKGERIRVQVASAAHPLFARNLGTGEPLATGTKMRAADQEVFHDPEHPSVIELPVSPI
ncbi:MAG TPA: CocE/NonD family hydrolase [Acidimicrobiales bacterium]|nr:CocE/NonD family hydrolase [Acidimicrobiales bacterium]